jgi:hypothetical protein
MAKLGRNMLWFSLHVPPSSRQQTLQFPQLPNGSSGYSVASAMSAVVWRGVLNAWRHVRVIWQCYIIYTYWTGSGEIMVLTGGQARTPSAGETAKTHKTSLTISEIRTGHYQDTSIWSYGTPTVSCVLLLQCRQSSGRSLCIFSRSQRKTSQ